MSDKTVASAAVASQIKNARGYIDHAKMRALQEDV
jgi:hypothetical protein